MFFLYSDIRTMGAFIFVATSIALLCACWIVDERVKYVCCAIYCLGTFSAMNS